MIELVLKISKEIELNDFLRSVLDTSKEDFNYFTMLISKDKIKEVEEVIQHYIKKGPDAEIK